MSTVAVIDYGMGNLRSVSKALEFVADGHRVVVSQDPEQIRQADRVVLPGVGALRDCLAECHRLELTDVIAECAGDRPFLGICLGMQALLDDSEENDGTAGLGIVPGHVLHFSGQAAGRALKIPHMGWNQVHQEFSHPLFRGIKQDARFYFVHSYYVAPAQQDVIAATTEYGQVSTSALARRNIFAVQFHPEKSQHDGLTLLANFLSWDGTAT